MESVGSPWNSGANLVVCVISIVIKHDSLATIIKPMSHSLTLAPLLRNQDEEAKDVVTETSRRSVHQNVCISFRHRYGNEQ